MPEKSQLKAEIDERLDIAERLLKEIEADLNSCRRILNGQGTMLKRIKRLWRQPELELFPPEKMNKRAVNRLMEKCLKSLVETI